MMKKFPVPVKSLITSGRARKVIQIDLATNKVVAVYKSIKAAANAINVCDTNIRDCLNGQQKTSGGYRWEYLKIPANDPL